MKWVARAILCSPLLGVIGIVIRANMDVWGPHHGYLFTSQDPYAWAVIGAIIDIPLAVGGGIIGIILGGMLIEELIHVAEWSEEGRKRARDRKVKSDR